MNGVFDIESRAVELGGKSGPMDISDFIDLVDRNKRIDSLNWKRGKDGNHLSHLCSLHAGPIEAGDARNVPTPVVPEFTQFIDKENRVGIYCRGWRSLLTIFVIDGWIYPKQEIRKWLGDPMWDWCRRGIPWV